MRDRFYILFCKALNHTHTPSQKYLTQEQTKRDISNLHPSFCNRTDHATYRENQIRHYLCRVFLVGVDISIQSFPRPPCSKQRVDLLLLCLLWNRTLLGIVLDASHSQLEKNIGLVLCQVLLCGLPCKWHVLHYTLWHGPSCHLVCGCPLDRVHLLPHLCFPTHLVAVPRCVSSLEHWNETLYFVFCSSHGRKVLVDRHLLD